MSNHLIQPIKLTNVWTFEDMGLQCIKHGSTTPKWRTVSSVYDEWTALVGAEDDDKWAKTARTMYSNGLVYYATSCLTKATLRFYLPEITSHSNPLVSTIDFQFDLSISPRDNDFSDDYRIVYDYNLATVQIGDPAQTVDYVVDLETLGIECRSCGNFWTIAFRYYGIAEGGGDVDGTAGQMTLEIVDVTF
jgi:hypothetical protein